MYLNIDRLASFLVDGICHQLFLQCVNEAFSHRIAMVVTLAKHRLARLSVTPIIVTTGRIPLKFRIIAALYAVGGATG